MGDLYVHMRMKECCRSTLSVLDEHKKKARFKSGMLGKPSWLKTLGDQAIHVAKEAIVVHEAMGGGKLERVTQAICAKICEQHAALHAGKGETEEGAFWHELHAACTGQPAPKRAILRARSPAKPTQAQAAELGNRLFDGIQGALKTGAGGAVRGVGGGILKDLAVDKIADALTAHGQPDAANALKGVNTLYSPIVSGDDAKAANLAAGKYIDQVHDGMVADIQSDNGVFVNAVKVVNQVGGIIAKPFEMVEEGGQFIVDQFKIPIAR